MNDDTGSIDAKRAQAQYAQIVAVRSAEVAAVWQRYNIQWLINAAVLVAFVPNRGAAGLLPRALAAIGLTFAGVWWAIVVRGHWWVNFWNKELRQLERDAGVLSRV